MYGSHRVFGSGNMQMQDRYWIMFFQTYVQFSVHNRTGVVEPGVSWAGPPGTADSGPGLPLFSLHVRRDRELEERCRVLLVSQV